MGKRDYVDEKVGIWSIVKKLKKEPEERTKYLAVCSNGHEYKATISHIKNKAATAHLPILAVIDGRWPGLEIWHRLCPSIGNR